MGQARRTVLVFWDKRQLQLYPGNGGIVSTVYYRGAGGQEEDFIWGQLQQENVEGNFHTPPILVQGHQTQQTSTPLTLGSLWTISCAKLWQAQILNNANSSEIQKTEQGLGWLSILKEALARGTGVMRVECPKLRNIGKI